MRKQQAQKFWGELRDNAVAGDVINRYRNREGYGSARTLQRYAQAHNGFIERDHDESVSTTTGWSRPYVARLREWHVELFEAGPDVQASVVADLLGTSAQETRGDTQTATNAEPHGIDDEVGHLIGQLMGQRIQHMTTIWT